MVPANRGRSLAAIKNEEERAVTMNFVGGGGGTSRLSGCSRQCSLTMPCIVSVKSSFH